MMESAKGRSHDKVSRDGSCDARARVVLHLDVDNFYCAVECIDDPSLIGRPLAVTQGNSGGFVAISQESKAAGVRKGDGVGARGRAQIETLRRMGSRGVEECKRLCPGLVVRPMRVERYREVGAAVLSVLQSWGAPVEKTSCDDYYIDVTSIAAVVPPGNEAEAVFSHVHVWPCNQQGRDGRECTSARCSLEDIPSDLRRGCEIAEELRRAVRSAVGLVASVGVGRSKLVARMLSPIAKPDGIMTVADERACEFMGLRSVRSLPGLQQKRGHEIHEKLAAVVQINAVDGGGDADRAADVTLGDAMALTVGTLRRLLGAADAALLARLAVGDDCDASVAPRGLPKQMASELSFPPTSDMAKLKGTLRDLAAVLWRRLVAEAPKRHLAPLRLVVTWRQGYPSAGGTTKGAVHSHRVPWPSELSVASLLRSSAHMVPANDAQAGSHGNELAYPPEVDVLAAYALRTLRSKLSIMPELTRLVVSADFGQSLAPGRGDGVESLRQHFIASKPTPTVHSTTSTTSPVDRPAIVEAAGGEWFISADDVRGEQDDAWLRDSIGPKLVSIDHEHANPEFNFVDRGRATRSTSGEVYVRCPVCGVDLSSAADNVQLNKHIDRCLNEPHLPRRPDGSCSCASDVEPEFGTAEDCVALSASTPAAAKRAMDWLRAKRQTADQAPSRSRRGHRRSAVAAVRAVLLQDLRQVSDLRKKIGSLIGAANVGTG